MAKFLADETLRLEERDQLFVCGRIAEGTISVGDYLVLPWNTETRIEGRIVAVEFVDRISEGVSKVALGIECSDEDERQFWQMMNIGEGEELEIRGGSIGE